MYSPRSNAWLAPLAALILAALPAISQAQKPENPGGGGGGGGGGEKLEYDVFQLDSAGGAFSGFAADLDDIGTVVGSAVDNATGERFAACWEVTVASDGTVTSQLNLLPSLSDAHATGVNNLGEIVGDDLGGFGLYWPSASDNPLTLLPLNGDAEAHTTGINAARIISGWSIGSGNRPVVWRITSDGAGDPIVSGPFPLPCINGHAWDLSELDEDGTVTVAGSTYDGQTSAGVTWRVHLQPGGEIVIDPPTILQFGVSVRGINNTGVACGNSDPQDKIAMLWTESEQISLALPRKFATSGAWDLSDSGVVVGWVSEQIGFPPGEAAVWAGPDAKPVLLSSFLGHNSPFDGLTDAPAINGAGVIVGAGWDGDADVQQAFIALPK